MLAYNHECEFADLFRSTMNISSIELKSGPDLDFYKHSRGLETVTLSILAETELSLHGKDETGNTTLVMAAAEKSHEMVSLLLQHCADANAINNDGRSALMEAALWGRIKSVKSAAQRQCRQTPSRS